MSAEVGEQLRALPAELRGVARCPEPAYTPASPATDGVNRHLREARIPMPFAFHAAILLVP